MQIYYFVSYFFIYGFLGWCTEVAFATVKQRQFVNRGFLNGPICPVYGIGVGSVVILLETKDMNIAALYLVSTALVTAIEGMTGYLMDKIFHHKWWDYSNQPLNIGGYVCLVFSLAWGVACVVIVRVIHPVFRKGVEMIPLTVGIVLAVVFSGVTFVDMCATAAEVLKLNKKLETMDKIAGELKEISDRLGENIHENVMETLERSQETRRQLEESAAELRGKLENASEEQKRFIEERIERMEEKIRENRYREEQRAITAELRGKYAELKGRYTELSERTTRITRRLLGAFPRMESRHHREMLNELKSRMRRKED